METKVLREYKKVTIFKVLRYDAYVWQAGARFQDMKTLIGLGGYLAIDREHILSMKEIQKKYCHEWVLFIYLCIVAFHSPTEVELLNEKRRLGKGQVIVEIDRLASLTSKDSKATFNLIKKLARKKLISYQAVRSGKGPETLIITVDTYNYFTQNLKKVDNDLDNALGEGTEDGEAAGLVTSENASENSFNNEMKMNRTSTGELPAVVLPTPASPKEANEDEDEDEEAKDELVDEIMKWTYDKENGFYERTDPETLRKQLGHVIDNIGIWKVRSIFGDISLGKPWGDFDNENKCALTELWNQLKFEKRRIERPAPKLVKVPEKKYIQMEDPIREAIYLLEHLNSILCEKLGIETVAVCLLLDKNYIGWTGYSLGQFKEEHAEVLAISTRTMHRIIARLLHLGLLEKDKATNRVRFHSYWYDLRKSFIEKSKQNNGGENGEKNVC